MIDSLADIFGAENAAGHIAIEIHGCCEVVFSRFGLGGSDSIPEIHIL